LFTPINEDIQSRIPIAQHSNPPSVARATADDTTDNLSDDDDADDDDDDSITTNPSVVQGPAAVGEDEVDALLLEWTNLSPAEVKGVTTTPSWIR